MKRSTYLLAILSIFICATLICGAGCGEGSGSSSTPRVSSVTDANGTALSTSETTTGIDPSSLTITFTTPMSDSAIVTSSTNVSNKAAGDTGNITLTCDNETLIPDITIQGAGGDRDTYILTVTDSWRYALTTCTLTFTTRVVNFIGIALKSDVAFTFTNGCAVSDDFNADSSSCWTVVDYSGDPGFDSFADWAALLDETSGILDFNTSNSTLDYSTAARAKASATSFYKQVTIDAASADIVIHFDSASGFTDNLGSLTTSDLGMVVLSDNEVIPAATKTISFGMGILPPLGATQACSVLYTTNPGGGSTVQAGAAAACPSGSEYSVRLTITNNVLGAEYAVDGGSFSTLPLVDVGGGAPVAFPTNIDFTDMNYMSIFLFDAATNNEAAIDYVDAEGVSSSTQY